MTRGRWRVNRGNVQKLVYESINIPIMRNRILGRNTRKDMLRFLNSVLHPGSILIHGMYIPARVIRTA